MEHELGERHWRRAGAVTMAYHDPSCNHGDVYVHRGGRPLCYVLCPISKIRYLFYQQM